MARQRFAQRTHKHTHMKTCTHKLPTHPHTHKQVVRAKEIGGAGAKERGPTLGRGDVAFDLVKCNSVQVKVQCCWWP